MFRIEHFEPESYRKKTRNATLIIMGIFVVIGFITASLAVHWFGEYSNNLIVLNFMGAFVGLIITAAIVKAYFADKPWMREAMYAWKLKRHLMAISNVINQVKDAVDAGDEEAMKILRFYQLGTEQMHKLENNNHALIDIRAEMRELEPKLQQKDIAFEQLEFDIELADNYKKED